MIDIKCFIVTRLETNCYVITDKATEKMAVVDPGDKSQELIDAVNSSKEKSLEYIFLTHGHYDHIGYAEELAKMFGAKIAIGEQGGDFLSSGMLNLSDFHKEVAIKPFTADILLKDNQVIALGDAQVKYIATPGHTKGCGCYIIDNNIFCGDTLFCESYGRTDLITGSDSQMAQSIKRLKNLQGDYNVYPGHGSFSTLEHERKYNPLMSMV